MKPRAYNLDDHRSKPRVSIVMDPSVREAADALASERGLSLSVLLEQLVRAEVAREKRRTER